MNISFRDVPTFGALFDKIQKSFILLNENFNVVFYNKYAELLLSIENESVGFGFNELMQLSNKQVRLNNLGLVNNVPIQTSTNAKQLELHQVTIDNEDMWLITDQVIIEKQDAYNILAKASTEITGFSTDLIRTPQNYIDEIRGFFENIIKRMPCYVYWKDKNFRYVFINDLTAQIMGLSSPQDAIGKTDYEFGWDSALVDSYRETDTKIINTGKSVKNHQEDLIDKNGKVYHTLVNKLPLKSSSGEVIGVLGITVDVTNIKEIELQLQEAKEKAESGNRAKSEFLANMGHDSRTPLTGLIGFSELLCDEVTNPEHREHAALVYECANQLLELFNSILDLIEADKLSEDDINSGLFDVREMIEELMALERPAVKMKHLDFFSEIDDQVPLYLVGDKTKLKRVLLNLIGNALKFTEKGSITLNVGLESLKEGMVSLIFSVKDTGVGIAKECQGKIFERFFKITPSYKGRYKGYGLGLHIVQRYVTLLGGQVSLESELGHGTTFLVRVTLPVGEEPAPKRVGSILAPNPEITDKTPVAVTKASQVASTPALLKDKLQVLLVEDNRPALVVLKSMVSRYDVQVSTAMDAEKAFELIQARDFDLLITDLGLPGKQGTDLSAMIRKFEHQEIRRPAMKIVALTGHAIDEVKRDCIQAGMNEVFRKPMQKDVLDKLLNPLITSKTLTPSAPTKKTLGVALPETEAELFQIEQLPLFDMAAALNFLGDEALIREMFQDFRKDGIDGDLPALTKAHDEGDWATVERLAHKMKGGAAYGSKRLHQAFLYMERYLKAGHSNCSEQLYQQMMTTIEETTKALEGLFK